MDEVRIRTKFMKGLIAKLLERAVRRSINKDVEIHIENFEAQFANDQVTLKLNTEVTLSKDQFEALLLGEGGR